MLAVAAQGAGAAGPGAEAGEAAPEEPKQAKGEVVDAEFEEVNEDKS